MKNTANIFQDGMILQRDKDNKIWGFVEPKAHITLSLWRDEQQIAEGEVAPIALIEATSDMNGRWQIILPSISAGGPYLLKIKNHNNEVEDQIGDIYFGDVWLLSGQSNMELPIERVTQRFSEVLEAHYPLIRQFQIPLDYHFKGMKQDVQPSSWKTATGEDIQTFSAVGYYFASSLQEAIVKNLKEQVPIGLILCAVGGTPIEAWMSPEEIVEYPNTYEEYLRCQDVSYVTGIQQSEEIRDNIWFQQLNRLDRGLQEEWYQEDTDTSEWANMNLFTPWDEVVALKESGVVWLQKKIVIAEEYDGCSALLNFGCIVDKDDMYFNREFIGGTDYRYPPRIYPISRVKSGVNILTIRLIAVHGMGGIVTDKDYELTIHGPNGEHKIPLDGDYQYQRSLACPALPLATFFQYKPSGTYQAMLAPLFSYGLKGFLWYQGESNAGTPEFYGAKFQHMITNWRTQFAQADLPFYFVQLAGYSPKGRASSWAELRDEQSKALHLPNTGMAIAYDLGEVTDIHPLDKKTVGVRLAYLAMKNEYGITVQSKGPSVECISYVDSHKDGEDQWLKVTYTHMEGNETNNNNEAEQIYGFSLWVDQYEIPVLAFKQGNDVFISMPTVIKSEDREQLSLSYAWSDDPSYANLYNEAGLPAEPFRIRI